MYHRHSPLPPVLLVLLLAMVALSLAGCGTDSGAPSSGATETAAPDVGIDVVSWDEASSYVGETVTVEGPVVSAVYSVESNGEPTFLNVGLDYPEPGRFTVVIWGVDRGAFPVAPESMYEGQEIRVSGEISEYDGRAQVEVSSPDSIEIVE